MNFKNWLEQDVYQKLFPWATEEDPIDNKKLNRFKSKENYIKSQTKGARSTEIAAEKLISAKANGWFTGEEDLLELVPGAIIIPEKIYPNGTIRPQWYIAVAHLKTKNNVNQNHSYYDRPRHRILAYYQGKIPEFNKERLSDEYPIGGVSYIGDYIDTVWVAPQWRGSHDGISLYKSLRDFAKKRGAVSLKPDDELTSKSFRAAQAKHDWSRFQSNKTNIEQK